MPLTLPADAVRKVNNTTSYVVSRHDELLLVTPSAQTTVHLYSANGHDCTGKTVAVRNIGNYKVYLTSNTGLVDGVAFYPVEPSQVVTVKSDGTDWWVSSNDDLTHQIEHLGVSGTITIDWELGKNHVVVLNGGATFLFSGGKPGGHYNLIVWQDGAGGHAFTFGSGNVAWSGNIAPTQTTVAGTVDFYAFYYDGSTYIGAGSLYTV